MPSHTDQAFRASIAGLIINDKKEFLLTRLVHSKEEHWDFVKGGMDPGEDELDTMNREISEEIGSDVKYSIIGRAALTLIYTWSQENQDKLGFRGQARLYFWVFYKGGEINIQEEELEEYKWVSEDELVKVLDQSRFTGIHNDSLMREWEMIKIDNSELFS